METPPPEKSFRLLPFVTHASRGLLRDQAMRRRVMIAIIAVAAVMSLAGATALQELLNPREHAFRFILFWLACGWLTFTALLLAVLDLLLARTQAKAARAAFERDFKKTNPPLRDSGADP